MPHKITRRRALGQHYLIDASVVSSMVRRAEIEEGKRVLEVGTGRGVVTRELCKLASHVEGFEVDRENYRITKALGLDRLTLHNEDAFSRLRDFDVLVSSLPYSESSDFVEWLAQIHYDRAVVLLQKDFAEKLTAMPIDRRYRAVSVISQISSNVEIAQRVGRQSFEPPPKVTSVIAVMTPKCVLSVEQIRLIKALFSQKRKKLGTVLKNLGLVAPNTDPLELSSRLESLPPANILDLLGRIQSL